MDSHSNPDEWLGRPRLVPWPVEVVRGEGSLVVGHSVKLDLKGQPDAAGSIAETFVSDLRAVGFREEGPSETAIEFRIGADGSLGEESYELQVRSDGIGITGASDIGLFWGTRTALQLLADGPSAEVPCLRIRDWPLLGHRGALIDVARRFHSMDFHLRMVKTLASYKLNTYQIHFSDDQSFTLPSERFPDLPTEGRHYSPDEIRRLVEVADRYHVTIVPEIDVPGHSTALNKGIPETNCTHADGPLGVVCLGSEQALQAVQDLFSEVMTMVPGAFWHLGADEVRYGRYEGCDACEAARKASGSSDVRALYQTFINRMNRFIRENGRQMFVWEGFQPGAEPVIDKDIVVFPFDVKHPGRMPTDYLDAGYRLINTSWTPLYVADRIYMTTPEIIARWNPYMFGAGRSPQPFAYWHKLAPTPDIIGAQVCSWALEEKAEEGVLFGTGPGFPEYGRPGPRVPIAAERMWTGDRTAPQDLLERTGAAYWKTDK